MSYSTNSGNFLPTINSSNEHKCLVCNANSNYKFTTDGEFTKGEFYVHSNCLVKIINKNSEQNLPLKNTFDKDINLNNKIDNNCVNVEKIQPSYPIVNVEKIQPSDKDYKYNPFKLNNKKIDQIFSDLITPKSIKKETKNVLIGTYQNIPENIQEQKSNIPVFPGFSDNSKQYKKLSEINPFIYYDDKDQDYEKEFEAMDNKSDLYSIDTLEQMIGELLDDNELISESYKKIPEYPGNTLNEYKLKQDNFGKFEWIQDESEKNFDNWQYIEEV